LRRRPTSVTPQERMSNMMSCPERRESEILEA
jgi:hypothetical protein